AGGAADAVATAPAATACGAWTVGPVAETFLDPRPAGTYDVYALMPYGTDAEQHMVVSEPVTLEVPEVAVPEQEPPAVDIRAGYQPEWLAGTDLECGAPASDVPGGPRVPRVRDNLELTPSTSGESSAPDELTLTFTETAGEAVDTTRTPFTLVWLG